MTAPRFNSACSRCGMTFPTTDALERHTERHPAIEYARAYLAKLHGLDTSTAPTATAGACDDCKRHSDRRHHVGTVTVCHACTKLRKTAASFAGRWPPAVEASE